jgi:hypothetical protein
MKRLLAIAFGISLLSGTLSAALAQGTGGSTDKTPATKSGGHRLAPHNASGLHQKRHRGGKKGKKSSGGSTTQPPK